MKYVLLFTGAIITLSCMFLPLFTTCEEGLYDYINVKILGKEDFTYYFSLFFITLIWISSFIGKGSMVAFLILTFLGGGITLFYHWINQAGWGKPCGFIPTNFIYLLYSGHFMILLSCYMNIADLKRKQKSETVLGESSERIDN